MSVLAKKRNVSRATVSRAVQELNIISYKRSQAHLLTGKMKRMIEEVQKGVEFVEVGYLSTSEILLRREDLHCGPLQ
ncbi:Hypothetical protein FKW44_006007 [Caligus rogercresseyi]|uniref:Uncharacterized protein n=1 Tax=Caligus rogercresseyi TaxID=217165 RepID=A0A7T8KCR2_CALRO|nr:Hypothetical protein FKW44_006007 [Caligus rogercresseyi]